LSKPNYYAYLKCPSDVFFRRNGLYGYLPHL